ncbi:hypothetical protein Tco_0496706, partial [Tanacetum coccineum]
MDIIRAQQKALGDDFVAPANHALKLTSFYKAFEITADVLEIYMQEFWVTASTHHFSLRFKMNNKSHTVNVDNFRDMLQICPKLPSQKFEDPPFEEEILSFVRDLGHTGEIKKKSAQASKGKILKTSTKMAKPVKKKQPATTSKEKGLNVLSEVALSEVEQIKLVGSRYEVKVSDDDDDADNEDDDGQDDDDQDDESEQTESDNDGDDFVHPKYSTHDQEERQDEEDKEEEGSDLRVQTPSHYESTDDEESDEETQGMNVEGEELDEEDTNEKEEANELYRDVNVNLEGRDIEMTNAPQTNIQGTQVTEDTHVIITAATPKVQ